MVCGSVQSLHFHFDYMWAGLSALAQAQGFRLCTQKLTRKQLMQVYLCSTSARSDPARVTVLR